MKRILLIGLIVLAVLVSAIVALPLVFKGKISKLVLQKANESVEASIAYESYRLSVLKSFPDFTATFTGVTVVGKGVFAADTLANLGKLSLTIDLRSLFKSDAILLKSITLDNTKMLFAVSKEGTVNWNLEKQGSETAPVQKQAATESKALKMLLPNIVVNNFDLVYTDRESNFEFSVFGVNGKMSGEMEGMNTILDVVAETPSINFNYHGTDFVKNGKVAAQTKLLADLDKFEFKFLDGDTKINNMPFKIEGLFAMPGDSMYFDFKYNLPNIELKQLFSLIPGEYQQQVKDVDASGTVNFNGIAKGVYYGDTFPAVDVNFAISNGLVKYPGLPDQLVIDNIVANITMPEGPLDGLAVGLKNLQVRLGNNPFSMRAYFNNLFADPYLDVALKGVINLETLSKLVPMPDVQLKGTLTADAQINGNYSAIAKNDFNSFKSGGSVGLKNIFVKNSSIPNGVSISDASIVLKNQDLQINNLQASMGESDFNLKGQLYGLMAYVFESKALKGKFELNSKYIDINELMASNKTAPETKGTAKPDNTTTVSEPIVFPKNTEMVFNARVARLKYDQLDITNFIGGLELKNQQLKLTGVTMNMADGQLKMNGNVLADGRKTPDANLDLNVIGFSLPTAYKYLPIVQKYLPFAEKSKGLISASLKVNTGLTTDMKMILTSLTSSGSLSTKNLQLVDAKWFDKLTAVIQGNKLKNLQIKDFATAFSIKDGNLKLSPFKTVVANQPTKISGTYNLGGKLDFRVDATLEKEILSADIQKMISYVPGSQNIKTIDIGLDIKGDAKKPEVKFDSDKIKTQVVNQLKSSSKKEIEDAAIKLINKLIK